MRDQTTKINTTEQAKIASKNIAKYFAKYILSHSLRYYLYTILDVTYELMIFVRNFRDLLLCPFFHRRADCALGTLREILELTVIVID